MERVHYYYYLLKLICYLECSSSLIDAEGRRAAKIAEKTFSIAWNKLTKYKKIAISFILGAPKASTRMGVLVSPDRRLILCRHYQRRVLSWVLRSFNFLIKVNYINYVENR